MENELKLLGIKLWVWVGSGYSGKFTSCHCESEIVRQKFVGIECAMNWTQVEGTLNIHPHPTQKILAIPKVQSLLK